MFKFNMNNQADQDVTKEMHRICDEHPGCIGCPMETGSAIEVMGKQCLCVTAAMKTKGGDK